MEYLQAAVMIASAVCPALEWSFSRDCESLVLRFDSREGVDTFLAALGGYRELLIVVVFELEVILSYR